jgi:hypothetical protein
VDAAQIRGKRRLGCVQARDLGAECPGELPDTLRVLSETFAAGARPLRGPSTSRVVGRGETFGEPAAWILRPRFDLTSPPGV